MARVAAPVGAGPAAPAGFLHGAGSSAEAFAPIALAWQLKFPGATAAILEALREGSAHRGKDWFDARGVSADRQPRIEDACAAVARRLEALQLATGIEGARTVVVGFSQGATVALELARSHARLASIVVSYAGQLARPIAPRENRADDPPRARRVRQPRARRARAAPIAG